MDAFQSPVSRVRSLTQTYNVDVCACVAGINETADNTGCGAPGDATHLLRALIAADLEPGVACFGWMYDPAALDACFEAGVGSTIDLFLGGKLEANQGMSEDDAIAGGPIVGSVQVRVLTDGVCPARPGSVGYYGPGSMRSLGAEGTSLRVLRESWQCSIDRFECERVLLGRSDGTSDDEQRRRPH
jgi:hypothetical protein